MQIHGWGRYPRMDAAVHLAQSRTDCAKFVRESELIARGMGRSYGDSACHHTVLDTTGLSHFIRFDKVAGTLACEAGVTIADILALIVKDGWFVAVTPGTSFVTVGGAIASDVHGKNHHVAGTFSQHVLAMDMLLGTGETVTASPQQHVDLFYATCGGMGLTGVILSAVIKLIPITSSRIIQATMKARCLEEVCDQFSGAAASTYSVAWLDCMASGARLGRSLLMVGEHADDAVLENPPQTTLSVPVDMPAMLLNKHSMRAFNMLYYHKRRAKTQRVPYSPYFHPLDALHGWNRLYGKQGFVQYQFVLPQAAGVAGLREILTRVAASGMGSFLAVLKQFGKENRNLLSFPMEGYTVALDFKASAETFNLLRTLDSMVTSSGGRIYLTKDALMSEQTFKATYPRWRQFEQVRQKYGAIGKFASSQSRRLGLQ